jgi:hypothetical protein
MHCNKQRLYSDHLVRECEHLVGNHKAERLGAFLSLTIVACTFPLSPASARQDCRFVDFGAQPVSYCQQVCRTTPLNDWLARWTPRPDKPPPSGSTDRPRSPPQSTNDRPRPVRITSCKATQSPDVPGACRITVCGLVLTPQDMIRSTRTIDKRVLTPAPKIGPPSPELRAKGLLDGNGGFSTQNPAATGKPNAIGSGGGMLRGSPSSGGGLR